MSMSDQQLFRTMQRIGGLFFRKLHNDLNEADQKALDEWINEQDFTSRQFFEEVTDWDQIQIALQDLYRFDADAALRDVEKKINAERILAAPFRTEPETEPVLTISPSINPHPLRNRRYKYAVAAVLLTLIVGASIIFTFLGKKTDVQRIADLTTAANILPGGNKAILTLDGGREIALDDLKDGKLVEQEGTEINKTKGAIIYTAKNLPEKPGTPLQFNVLTTPRGGQYFVELSDKSKVWLNAASTIRFPTTFTGAERKVEMTGEAYFEIAPNRSAPFIVTSRGMQVKVLGTHFNINAYEDESNIKTTLLMGAIQVTKDSQSNILHPGQQAQVNAGGIIQIMNNVDTEQAVAWKNGEFQFNIADIESVMRQLQRWYNIDVAYEGKPDIHLVGTISRNVNLSNILKLLELNGAHFKVDGKKITVLK